ncbi:MAG TPA: hypothetical protein VK766_06760, partial [Cytophagaceae bacterium]|nr:hypothetical protein [Cytophagaceae bacterium]
ILTLMEVDFMELPVQFLNKLLLLFLLLLFFQCDGLEKERMTNYTRADSAQVHTRLGVTYVNGTEYTGVLYSLFPGTKDTAFLSSYTNGQKEGEWKQFYPHHQPKEIRHFHHGQKVDSCLLWWENGARRSAFYFVNDEYEGTFREWSPQGMLLKEMHYHAGHEEGSQKVWYENGKIKSNYVILKGRRYGLLGTKNCVNVSDSLFKK